MQRMLNCMNSPCFLNFTKNNFPEPLKEKIGTTKSDFLEILFTGNFMKVLYAILNKLSL